MERNACGVRVSRSTYPTDAYYGHASILASYCGLEHPRPILGHLQHGWNLGDGFGSTTLLPALPILTWNRRFAAALRDSRGVRNVVPIGSPFAYLQSMSGQPPTSRAVTIAYPFHTGDTGEGSGSAAGYARELVEREGGPVTVCLHELDIRDPPTRMAYESIGHRLISHGSRLDVDFLRRQRDVLLTSRRVVTNRVSTALWYAAALGSEISVYGDPVGNHGEYELSKAQERQRARYPALFDGGLSGDAAVSLAESELGYEHVLPALELARQLGWIGPARALARGLAVALDVRRQFLRASTP